MSRFIHEESFDDLESSLDKALNHASNNFFRDNRLTELFHGPSIPLHTLSSHDDADSPLMGSRASIAHSRTQSRSSTPLNYGGRGISSRGRRFVAKVVSIFQKAKLDLKLERHRISLSEGEAKEDQRYVSPRLPLSKFPSNAVSNAKYNPITFIPIILYEQFKFFFNLYFLLVALSQAVPQLRIGYLLSYIVPLAFVLTVTMMKEAGDDLARRRRDKDQNSELYEVLNRGSPLVGDIKLVASQHLKVGDLVRLHKDSRVPADMVLLQLSDNNGEAFIKTDQLDGETDWKLRVALNVTQSQSLDAIINTVSLIASSPTRSIHTFAGKLVHREDGNNAVYPLTIDNTMWANTVLASGTALGVVVYTGIETRQALNTTKSGVKTGLLEIEINRLSKILCVVVFLLSIGLVLAHGFPLKQTWYIDILRFLILFSTIIPVSLRVNLDLAKSVYALQIHKDDEIEGTIVRTSTIPEDLGRIEYLLSDKTGTLTQNDMELKKLHLGTVSYAGDTMDMVSDYLRNLHLIDSSKKRDLGARVCELAVTLALCHNVTPTEENGKVTYQAALPDEIAIVKFCQQVGLKLVRRDRHLIAVLHLSSGQELQYDICYNFPFSSDTKRMGIIVKDKATGEYWFMQKGADTVMASIVQHNDWLEEETSNMAREGLRTLVIGRKKLSGAMFQGFARDYHEALVAMHDRDAGMARVITHYLELDLELLGLTGVEDKLQKDVKTSIELLRNAGIKIWMLTGDKVETAKCVSISARLVSRGQYVHQITRVGHPDLAMSQLDHLHNTNLHNTCLLIDGESLAVYMKHFRREFFAVAMRLPAVIACRCTPQQKADVATAIREFTGKRVCCIGDGGNDVLMIQCADVGVGIVGKEGKQASLAADFSINQFCYLSKLLLWHGRNSYKRSAKLGQFVIHRGLLISVAQAIYSICSQFEPLALYQGWLMVGYSTCYTMAPVFSLTLDCDIDEHLTKLYPELYKELTYGKSLSYRTFFMWVVISLYQGLGIQLLSQQFQGLDLDNFLALVTVLFGCLIYNELIMVALQVNKWNKVMVVTILVTFLVYILSIPFLGEYFDLDYVTSVSYIWQTVLILALSLCPVWITQAIRRRLNPPSYAKVQQD